jgi:hypothetical protein
VTALLLAAAEDRQASPIALVVILFLVVAVVLLIRSMNKHLRKVRTDFPGERVERPGGPGRSAAAPGEERADGPADER